MSGPVSTWMSMYWADYFSDTRHLTCREHGAYLQLIGEYWLRGESLPDDDALLARITSLSEAEWLEVSPVVKAFFQTKGTTLRHKRIEVELRHAKRRRAEAVRKGRLGGRPKKIQNGEKILQKPAILESENLNDDSDLKATAKPGQSPSPSPSPFSVSSNEETVPTIPHGDPSRTLESVLFGECLRYLLAAGKDEEGARREIGLWRRSIGDDGYLLEMFREAQAIKARNPAGFIQRKVEKHLGTAATAKVVPLHPLAGQGAI